MIKYSVFGSYLVYFAFQDVLTTISVNLMGLYGETQKHVQHISASGKMSAQQGL